MRGEDKERGESGEEEEAAWRLRGEVKEKVGKRDAGRKMEDSAVL
jgi:hypothetical protein